MIIFFCHLLLFGTAVNVIFLLLRLLLKEVGLVSKSLRDKPNVSRDIDWTSKIGFHLSSSISSFLLKMSTPRRRVITLPNFPSATDNCSMLFLQLFNFLADAPFFPSIMAQKNADRKRNKNYKKIRLTAQLKLESKMPWGSSIQGLEST